MIHHVEPSSSGPHTLQAWIEDAKLPLFVGEPFDLRIECEDPTPPDTREERAKFILEWLVSSETVDIEPEVGAEAEATHGRVSEGRQFDWVRVTREVVQGGGPTSCRFRVTPRACGSSSLSISLILRCIAPQTSSDEIYRSLSIDLPTPESRIRSNDVG